MTHDHYLSTNPADDTDPEFRWQDEQEEEEIPEPTVEEVWDGIDDYVFQVTFPSRHQFTVMQAKDGAFVGDWEIHGPNNFFRDGFVSPEKAISYLTDPERRDW